MHRGWLQHLGAAVLCAFGFTALVQNVNLPVEAIG